MRITIPPTEQVLKVITTSELTFNVYKSALKTAKHYTNVTCYFDYSFLMFSVFFLG